MCPLSVGISCSLRKLSVSEYFYTVLSFLYFVTGVKKGHVPRIFRLYERYKDKFSIETKPYRRPFITIFFRRTLYSIKEVIKKDVSVVSTFSVNSVPHRINEFPGFETHTEYTPWILVRWAPTGLSGFYGRPLHHLFTNPAGNGRESGVTEKDLLIGK